MPARSWHPSPPPTGWWRRRSTRTWRWRAHPGGGPGGSAAALLRLGDRRTAQRVGGVLHVGRRPAEGLGVLEDGVDLPRAVGPVDPHLVLPGEATGPVLLDGGHALVAQAGLGGGHVVRGE